MIGAVANNPFLTSVSMPVPTSGLVGEAYYLLRCNSALLRALTSSKETIPICSRLAGLLTISFGMLIALLIAVK